VTVLSVAYPLLPVGPGSAGGAEQILSLVERGLVARGLESIVIAAEGSQTSGLLLPTPAAQEEITESTRASAQENHLRQIEAALARYCVDVIHFHGLDFHSYVPNSSVPKLATLHLPPSWYPPCIFESGSVKLNCVSQTQADAVVGGIRPPVVPNGIETSVFRPRRGGDFLLWIGRICPEKGVHIALQVAHSLDVPLIIAGPVHPFQYQQVYFAKQVEPLLDSRREYIGPVGLDKKLDLLSTARCVLIPSLVAETSSLVAMEALAAGAPVIALRSGALPEIVDDEQTGFIVDSADAMAAAVERVDEISSNDCRRIARERFDHARMVDGYIELYASLQHGT
jgi:glycosyltransferase involved in cell wall biosynthesis